MWRICFELLGGVLCFFAFWQWSKARAEKKFAVKKAKEKTEDAKISTKPYVDNPFGRMRDKEK
jgi:hypothetical protein